jgi:hypothetical protein
MNENARDRRPGDADHDPLMPPGGDEDPTDAGGYIGHEPELARETIPGGVQRGDVRVAAVGTRPTGARSDAGAATETTDALEGRRQGAPADDGSTREAGRER